MSSVFKAGGLAMALAAILAVAAPTGLHAADAARTRIISMDLGASLQTQSEDGFYADVLTGALKRTGHDYDYSVVPFKRAVLMFRERQADCLWALDAKLLADLGYAGSDLVESEPFFVSTLHVFMAPGAPAVERLEELNGKRVAVLLGSPVGELFKGLAIKPELVVDEDTKIRMLVRGRVDAIGGWLPDILVAFRANQMAPTAYNPALPLATSKVGIVCHRTQTTVAFLEAVNPKIRQFVESGAVQTLLAARGLHLM